MEIKNRVHAIELMEIAKLNPHPKNRNTHTDEQIERLAKLIEYQGIRKPITVSNLSGYITAGHARLKAAQLLGIKQWPVVFQDYDSEEQEYADVQADNAIAGWAFLDFAAINTDIGDLGPDFDIDMLGVKDFVIEPAELPNRDKELDENMDTNMECPKCGYTWNNPK